MLQDWTPSMILRNVLQWLIFVSLLFTCTSDLYVSPPIVTAKIRQDHKLVQRSVFLQNQGKTIDTIRAIHYARDPKISKWLQTTLIDPNDQSTLRTGVSLPFKMGTSMSLTLSLKIDPSFTVPGKYEQSLQIVADGSRNRTVRCVLTVLNNTIGPNLVMDKKELQVALPSGHWVSKTVSITNRGDEPGAVTWMEIKSQRQKSWATLPGNAHQKTTTIAPGASTQFEFTISALGLITGVYSKQMLLLTNSGSQRQRAFDIELHVIPLSQYEAMRQSGTFLGAVPAYLRWTALLLLCGASAYVSRWYYSVRRRYQTLESFGTERNGAATNPLLRLLWGR